MTGLLQWFINRVMHHSHLLVILLFSCCLVFSHCQLAVFSLSSHCCLVLILVLSWCHLIVILLLSHCHLGVISLSTCGHLMAISLSSHYCHLCWGLVIPVFFMGCWSCVCKQNSFLLRCFYVYIFYLIHFFFTSLFSPKKIFYPDIIRMFLSFSFILYRSGFHLMR